MEIANPGLFRPFKGTTCYFRNVELDETVLALLGEKKAEVLVHGDSLGCGSKSLQILSNLQQKRHNITGADVKDHEWILDIRECLDRRFDVVYALNLFCYIPEEEHKAIVDTIAEYNTKYLCVTHIDRKLLTKWYKPVKDNHERIQKNWRHPSIGIDEESYYIWERK